MPPAAVVAGGVGMLGDPVLALVVRLLGLATIEINTASVRN